MENEKLTNHRLNSLETTINNHTKQISELDEDLKELNQRSNDRYNEVSKLSAKLDESFKNQRYTVNRLLNSIDNLVNEMKETNKTYNGQFTNVDKRFNTLESKINNLSRDGSNSLGIADVGGNIEGKSEGIGNKEKITVVLGIFGLIEVFIRYVAPLFFS